MSLVQQFQEIASESFQRNLLRMVLEACDGVHAYCAGKWSPELLLATVPFVRRLNVETFAREPGRFDTSVDIGRTPNKRFSAVKLGLDKLVVTFIGRSQKSKFIQPYRVRRALSNGQLNLFKDWRTEQSSETGALHALLLFGGSAEHDIEFVFVVFPDENGKLAPEGLDLMAAFPEMVSSGAGATEEDVSPIIHLTSEPEFIAEDVQYDICLLQVEEEKGG